MKKLCAALLGLCLLPALLPLAGQAFAPALSRIIYQETCDDSRLEREYQIENTASGYVINISTDNHRRIIFCDKDYATLREFYLSNDGRDSVEVERVGDEMRLSGNVGDKKISRTVPLDEEIWYGSVIMLRDFVLSGDDEMLFYVTKPEDDRVIKLKALRKGLETVTIGGQEVETVKVKFTLPDLRSIFWSSYYWFRTSDGLLVKSRETRGGPGSPKVSVELVSAFTG